MTLGDQLGRDLAVALFPVGAEMGEGGVAAEQLAGMHAHHAAAERVVYPVLSLVKSIQHQRYPLEQFESVWNSTAGANRYIAVCHKRDAAPGSNRERKPAMLRSKDW